MKLWNSQQNIDTIIENFTIGNDRINDLELAQYDVQGSQAHAKMLKSIGILNDEELNKILRCLKDIAKEIERGNFRIEPGVEDVHSQIEILLTNQLGDVGKKIHTGRSRNDQVLTDLKLMYRDHLMGMIHQIKLLVQTFLVQSEKYTNELMPGYTHTQIAMVSSFGLWYASFAEALIDDLILIKSTKEILNKNPLGSAAGYGSSFPLDRKLTTELLAFDELCVNSIFAQFGRGKSELLVSNAMASLAYTLNKFAADVCLYACQNFNFLKLPDKMTTGSSIMPHKKNPDVFELIRAKCNQIMSVPNQVILLCNNLITGYHRDYQILKDTIIPNLKALNEILTILNHCLPEIKVNQNILNDSKYNYLYSVEKVNQLVQNGVPFRDAYLNVSRQIQAENYEPSNGIEYTHIGSIGNLGNELIRKRLAKIE